MATAAVPDETHVCGHPGGKVLTCMEPMCIEFRKMFEDGCLECNEPFEQGYPYYLIRVEKRTGRQGDKFAAIHDRCG